MQVHWYEALRNGPPVLITGAAGFIGFHLASRLLDAGIAVTGFDNVNSYYDVRLKHARLARLATSPQFRFVAGDLADQRAVVALFEAVKPRHVVHLAAQAGVRHSIDNPFAYAHSNLTGFLTVLEGCRRHRVAHLVYASSSSVYGGNTKLPFTTHASVDHPVSLYAATKKAGELMAHSYSHLYDLPATGLRFFTVYGPWGRPDMAYWKFTEAIWEGRAINLFNQGQVRRDFTYIDDIVDALLRLIPQSPESDPAYDRSAPDPATSWAPYRIFNIGAASPEPVTAMVDILERAIGHRVERRLLPMQPGDVVETWADVDSLQRVAGFAPTVSLEDGLVRFVTWYRTWRAGS